MNQFLAPSTIRLAGATTVRPFGTSAISKRGDTSATRHPSLPLASSQNGNLFVDSNDANLHWYLPDFALADDVDPGFAFVASQSGQDASGHPFNTARLTLRVHKSQPTDVLKTLQANPKAKLQEIPLAEIAATLTSFYTGDAGQVQQRTFSASVQDSGSGDYLLTFTSLLGPSVIGLYQDLTVFGKATIQLSASYQVLSQTGHILFPAMFHNSVAVRSVTSGPIKLPVSESQALATATSISRMRSFAPILAYGPTTTPIRHVGTPPFGSSPPGINASVVSSGTSVLRGTLMFDLDAGQERTTGDIWWDQKTHVLREIVPQGGAKVLNLGRVNYDTFAPAQLHNLTYGTIAINGNDDRSNQLVAGDVFAVQTRSGHYAKVQVVSYGYNLSIRWTTYRITDTDPLVQTRHSWFKQLPLGLKYKQDGYQLKYTVSTTATPSHVIRDADDLSDFSLNQTEFAELKVLGDVSQKYPTLSRLYIGVLSRTIVVIPKRYSILRGRSGCAAVCMALVDSSAAGGSKCKFEFDFTIAPEVSRIDFLKLTNDVLAREDLKGYTPKLPDFERDTPPSTLQTDFKSDVHFSSGTDPHTFSVTVAIHDDSSQTPAVANANLFIMRLCSNTGADLVGSLSLKLDDAYPDAIVSPIDFNFAHTVGTDEISAEFEEASATLKLTNESPLDLQLSRYALIKGTTLTEIESTLSLPANSAVSVPLPADHSDLLFAADSQMVIRNPMTKADVTRFLHFQTADVQETQYVVAVNGAGVDFKKVDSIAVNITFSNLPSVTPRSLKLDKDLHADSTHIVIPLENAVFSLPGTVNLIVHFVDPATADVQFTIENDFDATPILVLAQADIDRKLAKL